MYKQHLQGLLTPVKGGARVLLFTAKIQLDLDDAPEFRGSRPMRELPILNVELQRDSTKMYIVIADVKMGAVKEMSIFLKQATQVLMYCQNDYRKFIAELVTIRCDRVTLRDINKVIENLTNQNLRMQAYVQE